MYTRAVKLIATLFVVAACSPANATTVVINQRFVVDSEIVMGKFYQNKNAPVTFDVGWIGHRFIYECPGEETFDWEKIERSALSLAKKLNDGGSIDFLVLLQENGLKDCSEKR